MALTYNPAHGILDFSGINNALGQYTAGVNQNARREQWNALSANMPGIDPAMQPFIAQAGPDKGPSMYLNAYNQGQNRAHQDRVFDASRTDADRSHTLQKQQLGLSQGRYNREGETLALQRAAGIAQMVMNEPDDNIRAQRWQEFQSTPQGRRALQFLAPQIASDPKTAAQVLIATARGWQDPMDTKLKEANVTLREAQAAAAQRKATGSGASHSKNPVWGTDENGNPVIIQLTDQGTATKTPLPPGVRVGKDALRVDAGTHTVLLDPVTRQQIGIVPKNLAAAESQKAMGDEAGKAASLLPKVQSDAEKATQHIAELRAHPGREMATGWASYIPNRPGSDATGFTDRFNQVKGTSFVAAYQSLRGGGAITETESKQAGQALARMNVASSKAEFDAALDDFQDAINRGVKVLQRKAAMGGQGGKAAPSGGGGGGGAVAPGAYVYDPATGELRPAQ